MVSPHPFRKTLRFEELESRLVLSLFFGSIDELSVDEHHRPDHAGGPGGGSEEPPPPSTPIDLYAVVLHELGHSLGLDHSDAFDGISAIMDPYYVGPVTGLYQQDIDRIQALYPESGTGTGGQPWLSTNITYSFMPDGTETEVVRGKGKPRPGTSTLSETLTTAFGSEAAWQQVFTDALETWATASRLDGTATELVFTQVTDLGLAFNYSGDTQGDASSGDIRIGTHRFDGAEGTLAHAYYPPPNGSTAAGDMHLDEAENWADLSGQLSLFSSGTTTSTSGAAAMTLGTTRYSETVSQPDADDPFADELEVDLLIENAVENQSDANDSAEGISAPGETPSTDLLSHGDTVDSIFADWSDAEDELEAFLAEL